MSVTVQDKLLKEVDKSNIPNHVAIIMDGNGRWAEQKGMPRIFGHQNGVAAVKKIVEEANKHKIEYLTLFTFSVENWDRPSNEVDTLMKLLVQTLKDEFEDIFNNNNPDNHIVSLYSGDFNYYNLTMIDFIENNKKRFSDITGIIHNLKNHHINRFKKIMAIQIFENTEKTPLYNILLKLNKQKKYNLIEFYLYIHYNYFYLIKDLNDHMTNYDRDIFMNMDKSPWINSHIILNAEEYLYEKKLIPTLGIFKSNTYHDYLKKLGEEHTSISFSKFRLNYI